MQTSVIDLWHQINEAVSKPGDDIYDCLIGIMTTPTEIFGWQAYAHTDANRYTRNLIHPPTQSPLDDDLPFQLVLMCWGPGQRSSIHDHAGSECCMRALCGSLTEELFEIDYSDNSVRLLKKKELAEGKWTSIKDDIGWHRVSNESDQVGCSLHLYYPPIWQYNIICPERNARVSVKACQYHSINGECTWNE